MTVADLRLAIEVPPTLPWQWPEGPLARFATSAEAADLHVGVRVGRLEAPPRNALRYDSGGGIFDIARDGRDLVIAPDSIYARQCYYPLAYPLDELIFLHRIVREGGLMVHSCGILRDGHALLFTGPSGAGKTTISRLMIKHAGALVLSDDRIVLRPDGGGIRIFGTPWHGDGELSAIGSARLRAIHVIRHAPEILAEPLCGSTAACAVLENAFLPAHDPTGAECALDFVAELVERVPVIRLGFPKDERIVRYAFGIDSIPLVQSGVRGSRTSIASSAPQAAT
jgi:hypothetical protein